MRTKSGKSPPVAEVLIVNCFTPRNLGDAAIVEGLVAALRSAGFSHVTVATMYPEDDWSGLGIDAVVNSLFRAGSGSRLMQALTLLGSSALAVGGYFRVHSTPSVTSYRRADLVVSVGGGYLGAGRVLTNLLAGMNVGFARWMGKRTMAAPMSIRPCSPLVARILRTTFRATEIFARDRLSQKIFAAAGLHAEIASDMAFRAPSLAGRSPRAPGRVIGWAPRNFTRDHRTSWSDAEAVEELRPLLQRGYSLNLITQCTAPTADDRPAVARVSSLLPEARVLPPANTISEASDQYASVDVLLASRMHAAIGALRTGTPAVAVAYEEKVTGLFADLGMSDWAIDSAVNLGATLRSIIGHRPEIHADWSGFDAALRRSIVSVNPSATVPQR